MFILVFEVLECVMHSCETVGTASCGCDLWGTSHVQVWFHFVTPLHVFGDQGFIPTYTCAYCTNFQNQVWSFSYKHDGAFGNHVTV